MTSRNTLTVSTKQLLELLLAFSCFFFDHSHGKPDYRKIDGDHRRSVPNCGEINQKPLSRISNAEESDVQYPWAIRVLRLYEKKLEQTCDGAIISKR